jgi:dienelactone hydrolase
MRASLTGCTPFLKRMLSGSGRSVFFVFLMLAGVQSAPSQVSHKGSARPLTTIKFEKDDDVACLQSALETGDPASGPSTFILKAPPKCLVPWHYHTAEEQLIVIRGAVLTEMKGIPPTVLEAGGFADMPGKEIHQFSCKEKQECILIVAFDRPYDIFWAPKSNNESPGETQAENTSASRVVDLKASDGTPLKATFFAAAKPGPGVLLIHQVNRDRKSWERVAAQLATAGINTLTLDMRGIGESGGTRWEKLTDAELAKHWRGWPEDVDTTLHYLAAQPGVNGDAIGLGGAGLLGVDNCVEAARRHPTGIKSLVLLSGETFRDGLQFLHQSSQLPELFVFSDEDEYPPTQDAMKLLYVTASSPSKKLVHFSAAEDAPWLWYEPFDLGRVPARGGHGTDMFQVHPELPDIIVHWFVTTLTKTPGHAPADTVAAGPILNQLQNPTEIVQVTRQLMKARQKDSEAQLWSEAAVDIIGEDYQRVGDIKSAIEIFKLNLLAYPDSADANDNLADAYLADGQKGLARQYAEKALVLLDSHKGPASSWSDTEPKRDRIRHSAMRTLAQAIKGPDQ